MKICKKCGNEYHTKHCAHCERVRWRKRVTEDAEKRKEYTERQKEADDRNIIRYLLRIARSRAKEIGVECTITVEDIPLVHVCPVTGRNLRKNRGQLDADSYTLDRVDPSLGYVVGNVRILSWKANNAKYNLTLDEAERLVAYMKGEI